MLRTTFLTGLASWAAASAAFGQSSPPVRWWAAPPESFFEARLLGFTQKKPDLAVAAREAGKKYEAKVLEYRTKIQADITKLEADRDQLRKSGYQGTRAAWNDWFDRNRELFKPIQQFSAEFGKELDALAGPMTPRPAGGAETAPVDPVPPGPPKSDTGSTVVNNVTVGNESSLWATPALVASEFGQLSALPAEDAVQKKADEFQAGRTLDEAQKTHLESLVRKFTEKMSKFRDRRGRDMDRLPEIVRIIRAYPTSVRATDVTTIHEHWNDLAEGFNKILSDFESELQRIK